MKGDSRQSLDDANLPKGYKKYQELVRQGAPLSSFGLHTTRAQVFRFANRFRVASAFHGITLRGYSEPTNRAYGALFRVVLTHSVAEKYLQITRLELPIWKNDSAR